MSRRSHGTEPPAPGALRSFDFPHVEAGELDNGLGLRIARMPRLPVVTMSLVMAAGESMVDGSEAGLAVVTGDALEGGTGRRTGAELAEALEAIGADLRVSTGWDSTTVALSCLAERKEEAGALLAEVVLDPSFPAEEVQRALDQHLARIRQREMTPSSLADDQAARLFYADGVPYGRPAGGTEASVRSLDRARIDDFRASHYRPRGGGFVVTGDVDPGEIEALVRERLGGWSGAPPGHRDFDAVPRTVERTLHVVHRPGSVQSELRVGHPGVARSHPDYFPLIVANTVLGGAFTSRLNLSLRERHGFTYGVRSRFAFRRNAGPFSVSTAVGNEVTAPAVREIVAEIEAVVSGGFTDDEIQAARDFIAGVFPLRLETTAQVASRIAELLIYGLRDDWHALYRDRVRGVSRGAAEAALRRHVRPEELQIVIVGDADVVAEELGELDLGPVRVSGRQD